MAFIGIDNRRDLPKVSYSTALDYYVVACFGFVLLSILQFAGVHYFTKQGSGETIDDDGDDEEETVDDQCSDVIDDSDTDVENSRELSTVVNRRRVLIGSRRHVATSGCNTSSATSCGGASPAWVYRAS
jgi:hypothetical protein